MQKVGLELKWCLLKFLFIDGVLLPMHCRLAAAGQAVWPPMTLDGTVTWCDTHRMDGPHCLCLNSAVVGCRVKITTVKARPKQQRGRACQRMMAGVGGKGVNP
jgi:hypothetical protein